jgi:hypothetical protein
MDESKVCTRCGEEKPPDEFPLRKKGKLRRQSYCRACKRAYDREWYLRNRAAHREVTRRQNGASRAQHKALLIQAKNVPCADCGERYPPYVMDFDHVRGVKKDIVSRLVGGSTEALLEEIAKCDVVCANCHRERTYGRRRRRDAASEHRSRYRCRSRAPAGTRTLNNAA